MPIASSQRSLDEDLAEVCAMLALDPLAWVQWAYPWPINGELGPDAWQCRFLDELGHRLRANKFDGIVPVPPVRMGASTGHGVGKTALVGMIVNFLMSTRPDMRGTITANTNDQLEKKTWAGIREWTERCITRHWFEINSQIMYRLGERATWFCAPASCAAENSEAFAGQHTKSSTSLYVFDEASAIPDKIWEVAEGGLTDGEPMIFAFGNPTRNTGTFYSIAFGDRRDRWAITCLDSRETKFANKTTIAEWEQDYGEDSDFFRVRVRGLPPNADELQFIDALRVAQAQRGSVQPVAGDPLIAGVDVSGGGKAWSVCRFRCGTDARSVPPIRLTGEQTVAHDRQLLIAKLADALTTHQVDAMFIDAAFGAVIVSRLRQMGFTQVHEVNFGGPPSDMLCANMRAFMWKSLKEWLPRGCIDLKDQRLATDLTAPGFHLNTKNQLVLESKESMQKRNVASPDDGDALALTFAMPVRPKQNVSPPARPAVRHSQQGWMG